MDNYFGIVDYAVFLGMLGISMGIGVFYACKGQKSAADVLVGGKSMGILPVATSIMATFMSAAGLLGVPGEIFLYGTLLIFGNMFIVMPILSFLTSYFIVPVFYNLGESSSNYYLERRFGRPIRTLACILYVLTMVSQELKKTANIKGSI
jgi:sodium-coupled monocarboxylate transporter 8/12